MNITNILEEANAFFNECLENGYYEDEWRSSSCTNYDFNVYDMRSRLDDGETWSEPPINCDILEVIASDNGILEYNTVHSFPPSYPPTEEDEELYVHNRN